MKPSASQPVHQRPPTSPGGRCGFPRFRHNWGRSCGLALVAALPAIYVGHGGPTLPLAASRPAEAASHPGEAASRPATENFKPFQPGVAIDWQGRAVAVDSHVTLQRGPLEFLACFSGKEHESILRLDASAAHLYMALGLIGLTPGHPPTWEEARGDSGQPAGDLVDLTCQWEADGHAQSADAWDWLREIEYARAPIPRPWVFSGSVRLPDGSLAADHSGAGVAVVDFPDSLLALSRSHASRNDELWVEVHAERVPPRGTPVRLILRPAEPRACQVSLDFRGDVRLNGRYATVADLADVLTLARQLEPQREFPIAPDGALSSDVQRVQAELKRLNDEKEECSTSQSGVLHF